MYLETDRLIIRNFTLDDHPALWEIFRDPVTMEHMQSYTEEETRDFLRAFCVERTPTGAYAAVLRETGELIGYLLCNGIDDPGIYELGWIIRRDHWRRGFAYEAVRALMDHLFRAKNAHKVVAETVDPVRSPALMEKLGMRPEGVFRQHSLGRDGQWQDLYWYGLLRDEFKA